MTSAAEEAIELAASAGLVLDPWQQLVLEGGLGERPDGKWACFEVGIEVPRQNGKGSILEARELAGLFLFGERLILHSAHEAKTAKEHFWRMKGLIEDAPHLAEQVRQFRQSNEDTSIVLHNGARLKFVARSGGSGRGFSGDLVVLDEAMILSPEAIAALLPTLSARPNPQIWYTASAGFDSSTILRQLRDRGGAGGDPGLAWYEWSAHPDLDLDDRAGWAQANPALGIRIPEEFVERERAALPELEFARERLGIWDDGRRSNVVDPVLWGRLEDPHSVLTDPVAFSVDVPPDRQWCSIAAVGRRPDGLLHGELVERERGTGWVVARMVELKKKWRPIAVVLDPSGPVGSLVGPLRDAGVEVTECSGRQMAQACGGWFDDVLEERWRHVGDPLVAAALGSARQRPLGDAWAWHRKDATDISPLVALTLARWGLVSVPPPKQAFVPRRIH